MLSVCLITKNEELVLARCLDSVLSVADEIIVCDSGSTDSTVAIAQERGARVVVMAWPGDFAAARNASIAEAKEPWIMVIDADEYLTDVSRDELVALTGLPPDSDSPVAYSVTMEGFNGEMKDAGLATRYPLVRVFQNLPDIRYRGKIHEYVTLPEGRGAAESEIVLIHDQSHLDAANMMDKRKRNIDLLRQAIKQDPRNADLHQYLGDEYSELKKFEMAIETYQRSLGHRRTASGGAPSTRAAHAIKKIALALQELGDTDQALQVVQAGINEYGNYTDLHYVKGMLHLSAQDLESAEVCFRTCLRLGEAPQQYVSSRGVGGLAAHKALEMVMNLRHQQASMIDSFLRH